MQKYRIAAVVLGGLFLAPAAIAQSAHLAYATYRKNVFDKNLADEQQMTAQTMEMNEMDWGPWGGWPYGWYY